MKTPLLCLGLTVLALPFAQQKPREDPQAAVAAVLSDFHRAAAEGDGARYLGHLAPDAVLFGTDPEEHWTHDEYVALLEPLFAQGLRFENVPVEQHVFLSARGDLAWFDEVLEKPKYGRMRSTGVLRETDEGWKLVQYQLSLPIPNAVIQDVVKLIRAAGRK